MFKLDLLHLDTDKYAKAVASKILVEKASIENNRYLIIESEQNRVFLKKRLGIMSDDHITEMVNTEKEENTEERR